MKIGRYLEALGTTIALKFSNGFSAIFSGSILTTDRTITIPDGNGTLVYKENAQTFTGVKTFNNSTVKYRNPADTFSYTLVHAAIGANYNITLPLLTASDTYVMEAFTQTLTNKRINPRVSSTTSSSTPTPNADTDDLYDITALAAAATIGAPTGTPVNGQKLMIRVKDDGTARALSWNAVFVAGGVALPTTTVLSKILTVGFMYNTANSLNKWMCIASAQEA